MSRLLSLYHAMPPPLRDAAASLRGYSLRRWRYGADTDRLAAEAIEREGWSAAQWQTYQTARLAAVLERAATQVPYYHEQWAERRRQGDRADWHVLENWPVLEKQAVRQNPRAFLADDADPRTLFPEHTSGTSGTPLTLWWSLPMVRQWYALMEARWRGWYGVSRRDRWGILGGQLVVPASRRAPPFWVRNAGLNQLYFSSYHLAPETVPSYVDALRRYKVTYLWGYTSSLVTLAQAMNRRGLTAPMRVVITNAEPLYAYQRETIARAFACPVRETYGMAEAVGAASECEAGRLHLWPEVGLTETGASGALISTGLLDSAMPFVRYRVGDTLRLSADTTCTCGRTLPRIDAVEGRTDDLLYTPDGRRVGRLDPIFKSEFPIREAQIVQDSRTHVRVIVVPADDYTPAAGRQIVEQVRLRLGFVDVALETVDAIPRSANGKFKAVVCQLSADDIAQIEAHHA